VVSQNGPAQVNPVPPPTARNHVVDGSEGEALMIEMAMKHGEQHTFTIVDNRILRERREKSNTILRMWQSMRNTRQRRFPTHFYEYP